MTKSKVRMGCISYIIFYTYCNCIDIFVCYSGFYRNNPVRNLIVSKVILVTFANNPQTWWWDLWSAFLTSRILIDPDVRLHSTIIAILASVSSTQEETKCYVFQTCKTYFYYSIYRKFSLKTYISKDIKIGIIFSN